MFVPIKAASLILDGQAKIVSGAVETKTNFLVRAALVSVGHGVVEGLPGQERKGEEVAKRVVPIKKCPQMRDAQFDIGES